MNQTSTEALEGAMARATALQMAEASNDAITAAFEKVFELIDALPVAPAQPKPQFQPGDRVTCTVIADEEDWVRVRPGARGWVREIDQLGTVFVEWDNGALLGMVVGVDSFAKA